MHGQLLSESFQLALVAFGFQTDQNGDLADAVGHGVVNVRCQHAVTDGQGFATTDGHVFTDGGDHVGQLFRHGAATREFRGQQFVQVAVGGQGQFGDLTDEALELFVTGHEVRFRVHFDDRALGAGNGNGDEAFRSDTAGLLGGGRQAFGAQPVDRLLQVTAVFRQRLLAVHHAGTGFFTKLLNKSRSDFSHGFTFSSKRTWVA